MIPSFRTSIAPVFLCAATLTLSLFHPQKAHAVQYLTGINNLVGATSTGGSLDGFQIHFGSFANDYVLSIANYGEWIDHFDEIGTFTLLETDPEAFVSPLAGESGPFRAANNSYSLSTDPAGLSPGDQLYLWFTNSISSEFAIITSSTLAEWQYVSASTPGIIILPFFGSSDVELLYGQTLDTSYADDFEEPGIRLVTQSVPPVPEPSSLLTLLIGCSLLTWRKRA